MKPLNIPSADVLTIATCLATTVSAAPSASEGTPATAPRLVFAASCDPVVDAGTPTTLAASEQGTTRLRFHVSAQGAIQRAEVVRTSGWKRLDQIALSALRRCPVEPARDATGLPMAGSTEVDYVWRLD